MGRTFQVDSRNEVHHHRDTDIVMLIFADLLCWCVAVSFLHITHRVVRIHEMTHLGIDVFVPMAMKVQEMNLNGLYYATRYREKDLSGF